MPNDQKAPFTARDGYATEEITDTERLDWLIDWLDEYLNRDMPPACYMMSPDRDDIDHKIREARESHNKKADRRVGENQSTQKGDA